MSVLEFKDAPKAETIRAAFESQSQTYAKNKVSLLKNGRARMIQRHFGGLDLIFYNARSFAPRFCLTSQAVLRAEASR
jgi:hypothetical protein